MAHFMAQQPKSVEIAGCWWRVADSYKIVFANFHGYFPSFLPIFCYLKTFLELTLWHIYGTME